MEENIINSSELNNLINYYQEGRLAHAYLISTNDIELCYKSLLNVVKSIFCVEKYEPNCNKCSLCHLIDINNLPSLKTIIPDGASIKKEQILELKEAFSKSSVYTKEEIYIIKNAEKMNKEAANTMLKFLEEPDGQVIGFFITNNKENVLTTIKSRCQQIDCNFENINKCELSISDEEILNYLKEIESNKKSILVNKGSIQDLAKEELISLFKYVLNIYKTALEYKINKKQNVIDFLESLSIRNLQQKVNLIIELLNKLNYNINVQLLLDSFVLEMEVINNENL